MSRRVLNVNIIAERLKKLRTDAGMAQKSVSVATGLSINTIKNYEGGRRVPDHLNCRILSKFYNVDEHWLLGITDKQRRYGWNTGRGSEVI